jgi:hypothetical protein
MATTIKVSLSTDQFRQAIEQYIDSNKPDPLSTKLFQAWILEWTDDPFHPPQKAREDTTTPSATSRDHHQQEQQHVIQGTLSISGEYMVLFLHVSCQWTTLLPNDPPGVPTSQQQQQKQQHGTLSFSCHASARFIEPPSSPPNDPQQPLEDSLSSKKNKNKKSRKSNTTTIHSKMITRLKQDAYISKLPLLPPPQSQVPGQKQSSSLVPSSSSELLVAQAEIVLTSTELEERVSISEEGCEGIKRAMWPTAESTLDVVDLLVNLPFLPTTTTTTTTTTTKCTTTTLANRAKLRLLEDAMCDACEKEGEEELLEELQISVPKKQKR